MTFQIGLLLFLVGVTVLLFWWERISAEVIALGLLLTLVLTGLLPAEEAFTGFANDAVVMILGLLILTASLQRTGVIDLAGRAVLQRTGKNANWILLAVMLSSACLGAFVSNTASTAFFLPVVVGIARRAGIS